MLKVFLILIFILIFVQDFKSRLVYWFLYPMVGILAFVIQLDVHNYEIALVNVLINGLFISTMLLITFAYSKIIMKKSLINGTMGIGDVLLFFSLCFTFSFLSFIVLLTFSLLFSLILNLALKNNFVRHTSVPLAGYISIFFGFVYIGTFLLGNGQLFAL